MSVVVDASIAVKWVIAEEGHLESLELSRAQPLVAPDLVLVEAANVLWKKVRLRQLSAEQARQGLGFIREAYAELVSLPELIQRALDISLAIDHPVYDCVYLACAEREQLELFTADKRLAVKVAGDKGHRVTLLTLNQNRTS